MDFASFSRSKISEYSEAFRRLADLYGCSGQAALRLQLSETADMLERIINRGNDADERSEKLLKQLRIRGYRPGYISCEKNEAGKLRVIVGFDKFKRGCISGKELALDVSELLGIKFEVALSGRQIVTMDGGEIVLEQQPKYKVVEACAFRSHGNGRMSGDTCSHIHLDCGMDNLILVDGMGYGPDANRDSVRIIEHAERLMEAGFGLESTALLLNRVYADTGMIKPVTVDMCSIDCHCGRALFSKMGAVTSFIKRGNDVRHIRLSSLPAGVLSEAGCDTAEAELFDGDYVIMLSDGILDAFPYYNKERKLSEIIAGLKRLPPEQMAENIVSEALFYDPEVTDDMTCLVAGIFEKK